MRVFPSIRGARLAGFAVVGALQCACSSTPAAKSSEGQAGPRDTSIRHENCSVDSSSAERLDANGDGKTDVTIVRDGNREVCRAIDLNFDGIIDSWIYLDANGQVRRRENDYDRDGRIDEITTFSGGVVSEKLRATMLANRVDTWEYFKGGKLARSERDSNGDQVVDQWWEYPSEGCPVIHADVNSDGKPDPGASVDTCKEAGYVPPDRQDYRKTESPSFQQSGALPTELENKQEKSDAPPAPPPATDPTKGGAK
ncbi:MAG: hypothetical protein QM756_30055 [Polyangiaceae bacterium]